MKNGTGENVLGSSIICNLVLFGFALGDPSFLCMKIAIGKAKRIE